MKFFKPKVRLNICRSCYRAFEPEKRSFEDYCRPCAEPMRMKLAREEDIVSWAKANQEIVGKLMDEDKEKKKKELDEYYKTFQGQVNISGSEQYFLNRISQINQSPYRSIFGGIG